MNKQKGFSALIPIALVVGVLGVIGVLLWQRMQKPESSTQNMQQISEEIPKGDPYKGWKSYSSTLSSVSFRYPADWRLEDYPSVNINQEKMENINIFSPADSQGRVIVVGFQANTDIQKGNGPDRNVSKVIPINDNYLILYNNFGSEDGVSALSLSPDNVGIGLTGKLFESELVDHNSKSIAFSGQMRIPEKLMHQGGPIYSVNEYLAHPQWQNTELILKSVTF